MAAHTVASRCTHRTAQNRLDYCVCQCCAPKEHDCRVPHTQGRHARLGLWPPEKRCGAVQTLQRLRVHIAPLCESCRHVVQRHAPLSKALIKDVAEMVHVFQLHATLKYLDMQEHASGDADMSDASEVPAKRAACLP